MLIHKSKRVLITSAATLALVVSLGLGYLYIFNNSSTNDEVVENSLLNEGGPCSIREQESILSQSASLFLASADVESINSELTEVVSERTEKLFALEERIIAEDNFEKDANCLHILSMLYIRRGDTVNSEKYVALLEDGLEESSPESYILDENVNFWPTEQIRKIITSNKELEQLRIENDPAKGQNRLDEKTE